MDVNLLKREEKPADSVMVETEPMRACGGGNAGKLRLLFPKRAKAKRWTEKVQTIVGVYQGLTVGPFVPPGTLCLYLLRVYGFVPNEQDNQFELVVLTNRE